MPGGFTLAPKANVDRCFAYSQFAESYVGQPTWERRINVEPFLLGIGAEPKHRTEKMKHATSRPGLRDVRTEVLNGKSSRLALDTGVKLRKPIEHKVTGGLADISRDHRSFFGEAIPFESHRDDPII